VAQKAKQRDLGVRKGSVAEAVRGYIEGHPVVREALALGIVNLSALTRRIQEETGTGSEEAILVACRRYEFQAVPSGYEAEIRRVLAKSKLEVRTRVGILTTRARFAALARMEEGMLGRAQSLHVIQGSEALTIIGDEALLDEVARRLGPDDVEKRRTGLVELNLRSPDVVEDVPGILSFLASSLSSRGINFVDVISCHKDNMFIIEEGDLFKAFEVLNQLGKT
jgi:hypothetical protein